MSGDHLGLRRGKIFSVNRILPDIFIEGRPWCTSSCVWRGEIVKKVGLWPDSRSWEDYAFDTGVAINNNEVISIEAPLVYYNASGSDKLSNQNYIRLLNERLISAECISGYISEGHDIALELTRLHFARSLFTLVLQSAANKQNMLVKEYLKLLLNLQCINHLQKIVIERLPSRIVPLFVKILRSRTEKATSNLRIIL
jgi:hypothetical protein